jgi:hypothetical protein
VDERSLETVISAFEDLAAQITSVQSELGLKSVETTKRGRKFGYDYAQEQAPTETGKPSKIPKPVRMAAILITEAAIVVCSPLKPIPASK